MILTVNEIHNMVPVLSKMVNEPFPVQTALKLTRICKALNAEMETITEKQHQILDKYCKRDENGEPIPGSKGEFTFEGDNGKKANEESFELGRTELELSLDKIDIGGFGNIQLTAQDLMFLYPLLDGVD